MAAARAHKMEKARQKSMPVAMVVLIVMLMSALRAFFLADFSQIQDLYM